MDELISFLRAALDGEAWMAARAKAMPYTDPADAPWERERRIADYVGGNSRAVAVHRLIAVFANPDRVLAEVQAKRAILDAWPQDPHDPTLRFGDWTTCGDDCVQGVFHEVLKLLAQPYAGQPGWRDEWAL